ncbi:hypothetical protein EPICR_20110 [Candidatus Desulfarcum epimagneticum]|uniref:Uncharacterized protein n=1 Tax=uncultured Desulfobacteraceae bacterium TaxID=218296 RepID=A0A484HL71_9BACT|nr:hypothetical protein EPICR_20110 [uncultured Desulfobacteraceae bacterium]
MKEKQKNNILIYKTEDGKTGIAVRLENEDVWLSQQQMAELYQTSRTNVVEHIKHIFEEEELAREATCRKFRQVQKEGGRNVEREIPFYNLDMIISLGYRIKSRIATSFRIWATKRLNEYIRKGFTMDDERLKESGGGNYWEELLDRIRDIRSSEKALYRQALDLYATSVDYTTQKATNQSHFSKPCKTNCTMQPTSKLPLRLFTLAPTPKKILWGSLLLAAQYPPKRKPQSPKIISMKISCFA